MDIKLKPCPMCGPENSIVECYQDEYGKWRVACGACGLHSGFRADNNVKLIKKHWNRRPLMRGNDDEIRSNNKRFRTM